MWRAAEPGGWRRLRQEQGCALEALRDFVRAEAEPGLGTGSPAHCVGRQAGLAELCLRAARPAKGWEM